MRILVVNANTSQFVTDIVAAEARRSAAPGTEIVAVTGTFGARVIGTRSENVIAAHATMALMAEHALGCDAAVIAVSYDTGLDGARELLPIPVVGMTEAALLTGCMLAGKIGVVTFGRRGLPMYQELVERHRLGRRIAGWRALEAAAAFSPGGQRKVDAAVIAAVLSLIEADGAEAVVIAGAVMAGAPRRLQPKAPVPLLDGVSCGVRQAELLARLGLPKPTAGSYARLPRRELTAVSPALVAAFGGAGTARARRAKR
ncbi:MAG: hydantoin racemase [Proteobacteria bacterium]|nr:hydantoin racemase [Pseudomonadota bacterium]